MRREREREREREKPQHVYIYEHATLGVKNVKETKKRKSTKE
ncbi:unnamed protein product [Camellia sinensis]